MLLCCAVLYVSVIQCFSVFACWCCCVLLCVKHKCAVFASYHVIYHCLLRFGAYFALDCVIVYSVTL